MVQLYAHLSGLQVALAIRNRTCNLKLYKKILQLSLFSLAITSCTPHKSSLQLSKQPDSQSIAGLIDPGVISKMEPLAWEKSVAGSKSWSDYIYKTIKTEEPQMLDVNAATDVSLFCPNFHNLNVNQRLNFWGQLFAGIAFYESGWSPTSRMIETTMGIDPITGKQVASEGLLQMSYQDVPNYGNVCEFDWKKDRFLDLNDPRRTILDPYKNLSCGIKIMAKQLKRSGVIATRSGAYWAVIIPGGKYEKIDSISKIVQKLSFCR